MSLTPLCKSTVYLSGLKDQLRDIQKQLTYLKDDIDSLQFFKTKLLLIQSNLAEERNFIEMNLKFREDNEKQIETQFISKINELEESFNHEKNLRKMSNISLSARFDNELKSFNERCNSLDEKIVLKQKSCKNDISLNSIEISKLNKLLTEQCSNLQQNVSDVSKNFDLLLKHNTGTLLNLINEKYNDFDTRQKKLDVSFSHQILVLTKEISNSREEVKTNISQIEIQNQDNLELITKQILNLEKHFDTKCNKIENESINDLRKLIDGSRIDNKADQKIQQRLFEDQCCALKTSISSQLVDVKNEISNQQVKISDLQEYQKECSEKNFNLEQEIKDNFKALKDIVSNSEIVSIKLIEEKYKNLSETQETFKQSFLERCETLVEKHSQLRDLLKDEISNAAIKNNEREKSFSEQISKIDEKIKNFKILINHVQVQQQMRETFLERRCNNLEKKFSEGQECRVNDISNHSAEINELKDKQKIVSEQSSSLEQQLNVNINDNNIQFSDVRNEISKLKTSLQDESSNMINCLENQNSLMQTYVGEEIFKVKNVSENALLNVKNHFKNEVSMVKNSFNDKISVLENLENEISKLKNYFENKFSNIENCDNDGNSVRQAYVDEEIGKIKNYSKDEVSKMETCLGDEISKMENQVKNSIHEVKNCAEKEISNLKNILDATNSSIKNYVNVEIDKIKNCSANEFPNLKDYLKNEIHKVEKYFKDEISATEKNLNDRLSKMQNLSENRNSNMNEEVFKIKKYSKDEILKVKNDLKSEISNVEDSLKSDISKIKDSLQNDKDIKNVFSEEISKLEKRSNDVLMKLEEVNKNNVNLVKLVKRCSHIEEKQQNQEESLNNCLTNFKKECSKLKENLKTEISNREAENKQTENSLSEQISNLKQYYNSALMKVKSEFNKNFHDSINERCDCVDEKQNLRKLCENRCSNVETELSKLEENFRGQISEQKSQNIKLQNSFSEQVSKLEKQSNDTLMDVGKKFKEDLQTQGKHLETSFRKLNSNFEKEFTEKLDSLKNDISKQLLENTHVEENKNASCQQNSTLEEDIKLDLETMKKQIEEISTKHNSDQENNNKLKMHLHFFKMKMITQRKEEKSTYKFLLIIFTVCLCINITFRLLLLYMFN